MTNNTTLGMSQSEYSRIVRKHEARKQRLRTYRPFVVATLALFTVFTLVGYVYSQTAGAPVYYGKSTTPKTTQTQTTNSPSTSSSPQTTQQSPGQKSTATSKSNVYIPQISPTSPVAYPQINGSYGSQTYNSMQQQYDAITNRLRTQPSGTCQSGYYGGGGYGAVCN